MAKKINLRSSKVKAGKRQTSTYGTQTPLSSTAVERGSTRWLNGSRVDIDGVLNVSGTANVSGLLDVTGTATVGGTLAVSGILNASGQINLSGSTGITGPLNITGTTTIGGNTNITGELNVTGPTTLDGELDIGGNTTVTGDLNVDGPLDVTGDTTLGGSTDITGPTTLKNHLTVDQGRRITLGGLVLENQGAGSAQVQMPGGGISASTTLGMSLNHDKVQISAQTTATTEAQQINLNAPQTSINGNLTVTGVGRFTGVNFYLPVNLPTTAVRPNIHMDSTGRLYKSTWTP